MWAAYLMCLFFVLTGAVIQEFSLHESSEDNEKNVFIFREPLPDTSCSLLARTTRICHTSTVIYYTGVNYTISGQILNAGTSGTCHTIRMSYVESIRFTGNKDTEVDGVSLYPATYLKGEEIYVDHSPFSLSETNVSISSLGWTGPSNWTLFEGKNFDGNHACISGVRNGSASYVADLKTSLALPTVGSLVKGCLTNVTVEMQADLRKQAAVVAARP